MSESLYERVFTFAGALENGDVLFKTEYGSLVTEQMVAASIQALFMRAKRKIDKGRMRIRIELFEE